MVIVHVDNSDSYQGFRSKNANRSTFYVTELVLCVVAH